MSGAARKRLLFLGPVVWGVGMYGARFHPWLSIGIAAALLVAMMVVLRAMPRRALLIPARNASLLAAAATAAMVGVTELFAPRVLTAFPSVRGISAETYRTLLGPHDMLAALAFVVPIVVVEELFWRGAFQDALAIRSKPLTVFVAASIYATAHIPFGSTLLVAVAFICGIYWSALRAVSGSLAPSLMSHLAWDITLIVIPLVAMS